MTLPGFSAAFADDRMVEGQVVRAEADWSEDGTAIVTRAELETDDGERINVTQLGGEVDDTVSWSSHSPVLLETGQRVTAIVDGSELVDVMAVQAEDGTLETVAGDEYGFVRAQSKSGPVVWPHSDFKIVYEASGTSQIAGDREFEILDAAFATWAAAAEQCGVGGNVPRLSFERSEPRSMEVNVNDRVNLVVFRDFDWSRPDKKSPTGRKNHARNATGITTITWKKNSGILVDADMEFNGVNFALAESGKTLKSNPLCLADLQNTATHEMGHFLGLDHTCWDPGSKKAQPIDEAGQPVPRCEPGFALTVPRQAATMFNYQACGEVSKRDLEPMDVAGLCAILADTPDDSGCGCRSGDVRSSALWLMALIGLTLRRKRPGLPRR